MKKYFVEVMFVNQTKPLHIKFNSESDLPSIDRLDYDLETYKTIKIGDAVIISQNVCWVRHLIVDTTIHQL